MVCTGRSRYGARPYAGSLGATRRRREGQCPDTDTHSYGHAGGVTNSISDAITDGHASSVTNADAYGYPHRYTRGHRYADRHA